MNLKPIILVVIALVIAGLATLTARQWLSSRFAPPETPETSRAAAAAVDIPAGARLDLSMINMVEVPTAIVAESAVRDPQAIIGQYTLTPLAKGELIMQGRVVPQLALSTLASRLGEGRRAITLGAVEMAGLAAFLNTGSRVDLLATGLQGSDPDSRTLLQNLTVLAVDPPATPDKFDPSALRSVTFDVDPLQAEQIVRATEKSKLRMTLRNPEDQTSRANETAQITQEPSGQEEAQEQKYKEVEVRVVRGSASAPPVESITRVLVLKP